MHILKQNRYISFQENVLKEVQRAVQVSEGVIAVACWAIVCEREQSNEKGLHSLLEKYYRGDASDVDIIPMHISLYEGENRFSCLYEDSKFEKFALRFGL